MAASHEDSDDLYEVLGVSNAASLDEIKRAWKQGVLRWHPDKNQDNPEVAHACFLKIQNAYSILSDAARREEYD